MDNNNNLILNDDTANLKQYVYGNNTNILYVIKQKMKKNKELSYLMKLFASEDNDSGRLKLIEDILISFTGAKDVKHETNNLINAQYLYILESLDKQELISFSKKSNWQSNSELKLADNINNEFENLKLEMYTKLMQQLYSNNYFFDDENTSDTESNILK